MAKMLQVDLIANQQSLRLGARVIRVSKVQKNVMMNIIE